MSEENKNEGNLIPKEVMPAQEIETKNGLVKVGDTITAMDSDYVVDSISQGFIFSFKLDENNKKQKIAIHPSIVDKIQS